ncbi:MAG: hypothetical protein IT324_16375 [Anaerolineae bacterium]|nr:hypothetical protein [Anaerolineae bacterium]
MIQQRTNTPMIDWLVRLYRMLLILYPADYRAAYGPLMAQVFRDVCQDIYRQQGTLGIVMWWCTTLFDLALTAFEQRRKVRFTVSKAGLIRFSGPLLTAGGLLLVVTAFSQLQPGSHYSYYGVYQLLMFLLAPAFVLIGIGNFGVLLHYGARAGIFGRLALFAIAIGALICGIGFVLTMFRDSFWNIAGVGLLIYTGGTVIFGLLNLVMGILPVFKIVPIITGVQPLMMLTGLFYVERGPDIYALIFMMSIGICWAITGFATHNRLRQSVLAAA